jgi:hypothetical protein
MNGDGKMIGTSRWIFQVGAFLMMLMVIDAHAGRLDPPGAPDPTGKTLTEVEPRTAISTENTPGDGDALFRITVPGSYYLTGNVLGEVGKHGIEIATSNVTIDLMGLSLLGVEESLSGIFKSGTQDRLTIRNGIIFGWGQMGIDLSTDGKGTGYIVEDVISSSNGQHGIRLCLLIRSGRYSWAQCQLEETHLSRNLHGPVRTHR